ncbi:hypothetical protein, partial [Rhizobium tropici]|uniref:hypothetical protein n=1 Tax=Rhizobium tropici TaxID=398 RepID=UPI003CCECEE6
NARLATNLGRQERLNYRPFEIRQIKARHHYLQPSEIVNHKLLKSKTILWVCDLGRGLVMADSEANTGQLYHGEETRA